MKVYKIYQLHDDNYNNHKMLKEIFPGEGKLLYENCGNHLCVLTAINIGSEFSDDFSIQFVGELDSFIKDEISFSIRLNTCKRGGKNFPNKKFALLPADVSDYVKRKIGNIGCDLIIDNIKNEKTKVSFKRGIAISHASSYVVGQFRLHDASLFKKSLLEGFGSGKAFGFGLLNIFR